MRHHQRGDDCQTATGQQRHAEQCLEYAQGRNEPVRGQEWQGTGDEFADRRRAGELERAEPALSQQPAGYRRPCQVAIIDV
jgi:hypothetical protein